MINAASIAKTLAEGAMLRLMPTGRCPRCDGALDERPIPGRAGGAYRSMSRARTCPRCALTLVSGADVGADSRLARTPAVRASEALHDRCPDCETRLSRLTLEWEGIGQTRIEECSFCGVLVVDGNEYVQVAAIVEATRALGDDVIERLVELARDSLPPPEPV